MGVSALRIAAYAGVLLCGLVLGSSGAGLASADPDVGGHRRGDADSSKGVNNNRPGLSGAIHRILGEQRKRLDSESRTAPRAKVGSEPDTRPDTGASSATPVTEPDSPGHPFPFYLLELRRGGGDWWNAQRVVLRLGKAIDPYLATTRKPDPEPEPVPAPAFRGPAPAAPEPEPVLDASGGVVGGGGSDHRGAGFGVEPVLSAPVVAIVPPPPAAARFPTFPPGPATAPGVGSAAARGGSPEPAVTVSAVRRAGGPQQAPSRTVTEVSEGSARRGYTDYLRRSSLTQLAGAALPGIAGILLMTFAGSVVGYRQASAGRMIRSSAAARYLP